MKRQRLLFSLIALLAIELLDEFVYGAREAAWPQIRDALSLSYTQIGLLLSLPPILGTLIESGVGLLGNSPKRRRGLVLGGGFMFALSLVVYACTDSFWFFLLAATLFSPASGAFVSLSQASLMDAQPERREQNMARWTLAGFIGVALGPLALSGLVALGYSWRSFFALTAVLTVGLVWVVWRNPFTIPQEEDEPTESALVALKRALIDPEVLRYLILLDLADLMMDTFYSFLALYLVDVSKLTAAEAGLGVAVWTIAALIGDALIVAFVGRLDSTKYLRVSALLCGAIFVGFQLSSQLWVTFILLALLGASRAGWYSILNARLYDTMPGHSGVVVTLHNIFGFVWALVPLGLGLLAEGYGLRSTLWLLLLGPVAILFWVRPKREQSKQPA